MALCDITCINTIKFHTHMLHLMQWNNYLFMLQLCNICPFTIISRHVLNDVKLEVFISRWPPAIHFGVHAVL